LRTGHVAVGTLVLAYSMFGVVGFVSSFVSPDPITRAISSGLTIFSYACISVLSMKLSFRELFRVLMPLNVFNVLKAYADTGYMMLKYQSMFGGLVKYFNQHFWYVFDLNELVKNNQTLTLELINSTKEGQDFIDMALKLNETASQINSLTPDVPFLGDAAKFIEGLPMWAMVIILVLVGFFAATELFFSLISNAFTIVTYPLIFVLGTLLILHFRLNVWYVYLIPQLWVPVAATVDSFLRIYILRALFFRFFRNHPLISQYAKGGNL